jgi:predicted nucleic acid-binding protein
LILLDAYALVALARDEHAAAEVEELLRSEAEIGIPSVNLLEVVDFLVRRSAWPEADVRARLSPLLGETIHVLVVDDVRAWRGASVRARHYVRRACELSLADCVLLACAREEDAVATADSSLATVARAEGIGLVPLPDARGRRP